MRIVPLVRSMVLPVVCLTALASSADAQQAESDGFGGYKGTPMIPGSPYNVHQGDRPQPRIVTPAPSFSHGAVAPSDAVVLFDGTDLSKWQRGGRGGGEPQWVIKDGYMEVVRRGGAIRTKDKFADFQLHLEFATPSNVQGSGQGRGNSGVMINGMYEVQVLDSYQNTTYPDGQAGAIYGQTPPLVNASKPPGEWQTYDIIFESPRWDEAGQLIKKANVTVIHNGAVLHHKREYIGMTDGIGGVRHTDLGEYRQPHPPEMYIELQDHSNPVRYRNIWIRSIGKYDKPLASTQPATQPAAQ
jgi:Domain of Unknown Function (DUF1080)